MRPCQSIPALLLITLGWLTALPAAKGNIVLTSPNGTIRFQLNTNTDGHLIYSVLAHTQVRLKEARAGIVINGSDFGQHVNFGTPHTETITETFAWRGPKRRGTNHCLATVIPIQSGSHPFRWSLEVRVFNDGVGFRYRVPGTGIRHVDGEATAWAFPKEATVWFQTDTGAYEGVYRSSRADQVPLEETTGKRTRRVHLGPPVTVVYEDGTFGLISESQLYRYSGLTLRPEGEARFRAAFEDDQEGWKQEGEILSPWRVLLLSPDLDGLVNSDVIPALGEPPNATFFPDGMDTDWIVAGKAPCTWMVFGNDGAQWDRQKWFVDRSAAMGCELLLVDAGWRTERWGWMKDGGNLWERAAELCRYASSRGVGIILWHAFPEGRDDGPGLTTVEAREELFSNCQKAGVKGVKIDFFNSESRTVIEAYEDLLRRAAQHHLTVNFHGANKPTGEARTWPNEISREGIREQEYVLWDSLPLAHYGALPFTRNVVGHADFLPGFVQDRFLKNTTLAFQMAATVVFSSPFLCWPDNPEAYLSSPLLHFVRTIPVTWDETRVLPGSVIGETVLMARRKDKNWYIAALNCRSEPRDLELNLGSFGWEDLQATLYRDGESAASCRIDTHMKPPSEGKLTVHFQSGGGAVIHLQVPTQYPGWR